MGCGASAGTAHDPLDGSGSATAGATPAPATGAAATAVSQPGAAAVPAVTTATLTPDQRLSRRSFTLPPKPVAERLKHLFVPQLAKGSAFTMQERQLLNLDGLLVPVVEDIERRKRRWEGMLAAEEDSFKKYQLVSQLQAMDSTLFYRVLVDNLVDLLPIVYTPTVGTACLRFDRNKRTHTGMYISYFEHRGRVRSVLNSWPFDVDIIVVTDGGRILGLGDLGTNGMGIPIGKIALYVAGGGFHPVHALPVQLDCGTSREEYLQSEFYLGARRPRISAEEHAAFLEEFSMAVKERWPACLIQYEDFATDRAFTVLSAMQKRCLCFNDDIQGTGSVVLAGFLNGMKAQGTPLPEARVVFFGAGSAACGVAIQIAELLAAEGGMSLQEARRHIYMFDQNGLLTTTRGGELPEHNRPFAREDGTPEMRDLVEVIMFSRPHALFGLSGAGPLFTQAVIEAMCASTQRPLVFPLSNPTAKAEITAENAYRWSDGKCIFAAGSPFPPVEHGGKTYTPGQGNNVFIFPGVGFGAWIVGATEVADAFFIEAAKELASYVGDKDLAQGRIYPPISNLREVSRNVAARVADCAYRMGLATRSPKPENLRSFVAEAMYEPAYEDLASAPQWQASSSCRKSQQMLVSSGRGLTPSERMQYLFAPQWAKNTAFSSEERRDLGLDGLLPPVVEDLALRQRRWEGLLAEEPDRLKRYFLLAQLAAADTTLFYKVLVDNLVDLMPVVYTPTVGAACLEFDRHKRTHSGMYVSFFEHRGRVRKLLDNWPFEVDIIVVTDGGRILGLGDLGTNGMGIPIGKVALYVAGGGFHPVHSLPVQLDCGTGKEEYLRSDSYMGARKPRISAEDHSAFLEEFCMAVKDKWPACLVQFEDFATDRAFTLLTAMQKRVLCFNDDIQGTGSVVLAGFINGMKAQGTDLKSARVIFFGAGSAACGVAIQIAQLLASEGMSVEEARSHIYMFDQSGLLTTTRGGVLPDYNRDFARVDGTPDMKTLVEVITYTKPHALFGLSGAGPLFGEDVMQAMCASTERPLIFPLSNPTSKAEITAENAYRWSDGKCIFAAGSPFAPVEYKGSTYVPGQGNNVFIFPGVGFGAWLVGSREVADDFFLEAARELASYVSADDLASGRIYPSIANLREVSRNVAARTAECAYRMGLATLDPRPGDLRAFVEEAMYVPAYDTLLGHRSAF